MSRDDGTLEELSPEALGAALPDRLDAMLGRLNAYDFLAAVTLAESVLLEMPQHELAALCRKEALAVLSSFLESTLKITRTDTGGLTEDAFALLSGAEGCSPRTLLPEGGSERVTTLRALHELVRLQYFEIRENTFVEAMVAKADELPRIGERADAAATAELERALVEHPNERFGIGRCEEVDFGTIWQWPAYAGAKDVCPIAIGPAGDMAKRENHLKLLAKDTHPEAFMLLTAGPPLVERGTHVVYAVIAPARSPG